MIATAVAFLRRDYLIFASYRLGMFWQVGGMLGLTVALYAIGQAVGSQFSAPIAGQSTDYFDFLLAGIAFADVFTLGLNAFPRVIRDSQAVGTLETMMLTHSRLFPIVIYSSLFPFLQSMLRLGIATSLAVLVFGLWHEANLVSAVVIFVLAVVVFGCLGVISASFILVLKHGDPVVTLYAGMSGLFGGLLFPITVFPAWIQPLAVLVPLTHALSGMRMALRGAPLTELGPQVLALSIMTLVFLPACFVAFHWAVDRAKMEGSLVQY